MVVLVASLATLAAGALNLISVQGRPIPERARQLAEIIPPNVVSLSRVLTLLAGLALVVLSINIFKRKRRALELTVALAALSIVVHLGKGIDYEEATALLALVGLLIYARHEFVVESGIPDLRLAALRIGAAAAATFLYGIVGFWLLDAREFGREFHLEDAIQRTFRQLLLLGNDDLVPQTAHAEWFLDSLDVIMVAALAYGLFALFRPVYYRFRTLPAERQLAHEIVTEHGLCALDYFKLWKDKTLFFSAGGSSFVAYRVSRGYALALGDPVGSEADMEGTIQGFTGLCDRNDWRVAFLQTLPDHLPLYEKSGFRHLKIGDDAIVNLTQFQLEGSHSKKLRSRVNQLEKQGVRFHRFAAPLSDEVLEQTEMVSDAWLTLPGRRERTFTLGLFEKEYVRGTPVAAALDATGRMIGFVNEIEPLGKGDPTIDLMRHLPEAPNGVMDYVFSKLLLAKKAEGCSRFSLGMAPMSGFQEAEEPTIEEQAVHAFLERLHFLFDFQGLRSYKAKFATIWEPRYLIYRNILNLPRVAIAIVELSELRDD